MKASAPDAFIEVAQTMNLFQGRRADGNTITSVTGSNTTQYFWDYENRMTSVTLPGSGGTVTFAYDPRVAHSIGAAEGQMILVLGWPGAGPFGL